MYGCVLLSHIKDSHCPAVLVSCGATPPGHRCSVPTTGNPCSVALPISLLFHPACARSRPSWLSLGQRRKTAPSVSCKIFLPRYKGTGLPMWESFGGIRHLTVTLPCQQPSLATAFLLLRLWSCSVWSCSQLPLLPQSCWGCPHPLMCFAPQCPAFPHGEGPWKEPVKS